MEKFISGILAYWLPPIAILDIYGGEDDFFALTTSFFYNRNSKQERFTDHRQPKTDTGFTGYGVLETGYSNSFVLLVYQITPLFPWSLGEGVSSVPQNP